MEPRKKVVDKGNLQVTLLLVILSGIGLQN